jgi:hypothetical protein
MSQQIPPPPKKVVSRGLVIGLGIVCIVLVVSLVAVIVYYVPIANLGKSSVMVDSATTSQGAGAYTSWTFAIGYAGYVSVQLLNFGPTRTDAASVEVYYLSHGVNYDNKVWIHVGETAVFPVLPTSNLEVRVGNGYVLNGATETVTMTYYY